MICNRCGSQNSDEQRYCRTCGHKLQSTRQALEPDLDDSSEARESLELLPKLEGRAGGGFFFPYAEAWLYIGIGIGLTAWSFIRMDLRPLYWGVPVVAVVALLRLRRN